jgi:uncharacterized protein (TIGR02996 family)
MNDLFVQVEDKTYLHYENWAKYRDTFQWENPRTRGHFRVDIELAQPIGNKQTSLINQTFYYACDEWTTISPVFDGLTHPNGKPSCRAIFESSHSNAAGERIILYSTFSTIWPEPWGRNIPTIWAFFRGQMWEVKFLYWMMGHPWKFVIHYPLTNRTYPHMQAEEFWRPHPESYSREDYLPETFSKEPADLEISGFLEAIYKNPTDTTTWLVLADWLDDRDDPLATFIRQEVPNITELHYLRKIGWHPTRPGNYRTLATVAARYLGPVRLVHPEDNYWGDNGFPVGAADTSLVAG